jgi:hypothetical protein
LKSAAKTSMSPLGAALQSVLFTNPTSSSDTVNNFTFTPTSTFTFAADTLYWLLVDATAGDNFNWNTNDPAVTPIGISGITFNSYQFSDDNGTSYGNSTIFNSFDINATAATAVPFEFEATGGLAILGGDWLLRRHLKKSTKV